MTGRYPVVVLAGGLATRMRPLTETVPKAMLEVAGAPFVDHQLRELSRQGVREVVLAVGFLGEQVEAFVGDGGRYGLNVRYSYDGPKLLGTGGAVRQAARGLDTPFFILYGDSYLQLDWADVQRKFDNGDGDGLMTVFHNGDRWDSSNVIFRDGEVVVYDKKIKSPEMNYIDYGLEIMRPDVFDSYAQDAVFDLAEVMTALVARRRMIGYEVRRRFYEIGSPAGYAELEELLSSQNV